MSKYSFFPFINKRPQLFCATIADGVNTETGILKDVLKMGGEIWVVKILFPAFGFQSFRSRKLSSPNRKKLVGTCYRLNILLPNIL